MISLKTERMGFAAAEATYLVAFVAPLIAYPTVAGADYLRRLLIMILVHAVSSGLYLKLDCWRTDRKIRLSHAGAPHPARTLLITKRCNPVARLLMAWRSPFNKTEAHHNARVLSELTTHDRLSSSMRAEAGSLQTAFMERTRPEVESRIETDWTLVRRLRHFTQSIPDVSIRLNGAV